MADLKKLQDELSKLTIMEAAELVKALEESWGVSAAAPVAVAAAGGAAGGAAAEEKTEFEVVLTDAGSNKISTIKVIREVTGLGLKEAKELSEGLPKSLKAGISKDAAEDMKKKVEEAGGKVEIK